MVRKTEYSAKEEMQMANRYMKRCLTFQIMIPGLGRTLGGGHGNPLQYSCLENPMEREAWQATVHVVTKSWT